MCGIHVSIDRTSSNFIKSLYFSSLFYFIFSKYQSSTWTFLIYRKKIFWNIMRFSFLISLFLHFWKLISQVSYLYTSGPKSNSRGVRCLRRYFKYITHCADTNVSFQHIYANALHVMSVFQTMFIFNVQPFKFWVRLCANIFLSSFCVLPISLFLCKCLNLCSSAAKRKRKMKKELMHILISVSMLLLYQSYWTRFHGGCISVFFLHLHCQLFSRMKCLGGYLHDQSCLICV